MYKASIDIGSNSTLLLVADVENGKIQKVCESISTITALGRDLDKSGIFHEESMKITKEALIKYCSICSNYKINAKDITVTATEASRVAKNASKFYREVSNLTGLKFNIINGLAEAFYSTQGILLDINKNETDILIMDIGGASTELIGVRPTSGEIYESFSMPCGSVRLKNWIEEKNENQLGVCLKPYLERINRLKRNSIYCVAGTMTSVGNMILGHKEFVESDVHGAGFNIEQVENLYEKIKDLNSEDLLKLYPFLGKRAQTISSGVKLALTILNLLNIKEITLSTYGLRYGTLLANKIPDEFLV